MLPPHRVSRKIRQVPDCPDPGKMPGDVNPGEPPQRALGTKNTAPPLVLAAEGCGVQRTEENQELRGGSSQCCCLGLQAQVPAWVLTVIGSRPGSCLCRFSAMMVLVNNAFSQTAYGLGKVWHLRGTDLQTHGPTA